MIYERILILQVATSSTRVNYGIKSSKNLALFNMFECVTCGDDQTVVNGKPEPDIFLASWDKLGNPPKNQVLIFEDSINGINGAIEAGMNVGSL